MKSRTKNAVRFLDPDKLGHWSNGEICFSLSRECCFVFTFFYFFLFPVLIHTYFFTHNSIVKMAAHREGVTTDSHDWTMVKASSLVKDQKVMTM